MNKAVFLDRDGVINQERGDYTYMLPDFKLVEGIIENLSTLKQHGFLLIVVSNQGGIGKGMYTKNDVELLHEAMQHYFARENLHLDEIYYCSHHPETSNCLCRKPDSLLLEKAMARFGIDPTESYMIGDTGRDMEAGKKAGLNLFKVRANENIHGVVSQIIANS